MTTATPLLMRLPLDKVLESPDNPRKHFDPAFVTRVAKSMVELGQMTPAIVRIHPKKIGYYELAAGATRLRAAKEAKLEGLDCHVRPMTDEQFLELLTFENLERKDLRPLEEARGYELLMKRLDGFTPEVIAKRSGVSVDYVRDRLRLLRLGKEAMALLEADKIQLGHAIELAKLSAEEQQRLIDDDYEGLWAEDDHRHYSGGKKGIARFDGQSPVTVQTLRSRIQDSVRLDLEDDAAPDLFPETVAAVKAAAEKAIPVVHITRDYQGESAKDGAPRILGEREWRRADGTKGAKACKLALSLGVVVKGEGQGEAFRVCTATTECRMHFAGEIDRVEREKKWAAEAAKSRKASSRESSWEKSDRLKREALARMKPAMPAILNAIAEKLKAATCKPGGPIEDLLMHGRGQSKPEARKRFPRGSGAEDLLRQIAFSELLAISASTYSIDRFKKATKALGVNIDALVKAHAPAPAKKGNATKKKARR